MYVTVNHRRRLALLSATMTAAVTATMTVTVSLLVAACGGQPASQTRAEALVSTTASSPQAQARTQPRRKSSPLALGLLTKAAQAAMLTSYWGVEIVTNSGTDGSVSEFESEVWHVSGGQTITQTQAAGANVSAQPYQSEDLNGQSPEGVLGVTQTLVKLLETHYVVTYGGVAQLDSRPARVVEVWRADGSLAAQFWLDQATDLPLQRQVFTDSVSPKSAHVISLDAFNEVQFGVPSQMPAVVPAAAKAAAMATMAPPVLLALNGHGWVVKSTMPGGLTLFSGGRTVTKSGPVLDLAYSDGLFVVSVFEERGKLASTLVGWQKVKLGGQTVYAAEPDEGSLTWAGRGMVYTLIADAPAQTVVAAVGVLPHDESPGFWKRLSHGFARLAHLANPFG